MWEWLRAVALTLIGTGAAFLPLAHLLQQDLYSSIGQGEETGKVFVSKNSPAALRGHALPGEGQPVIRIRSQVTRSDKALLAFAIYTGLGITLLLVTVPKTTFNKQKSFAETARILLVAPFAALMLGGFCGFFISWLVFAPLKAVSESIFNILFALIVAATAIGLAVYAVRLLPPGSSKIDSPRKSSGKNQSMLDPVFGLTRSPCCDGHVQSVQATAESQEEAVQRAERELPPEANVLNRKASGPSRRIVTLDITTQSPEDALVLECGEPKRILDVRYVQKQRRGIFGVGRRPALARITYFDPAVVEFQFVKMTHKWNGCKCETCSKWRDEGHVPLQCKCTRCGQAAHDYQPLSIEFPTPWGSFLEPEAGEGDDDPKAAACLCRNCGKIIHTYRSDPRGNAATYSSTCRRCGKRILYWSS